MKCSFKRFNNVCKCDICGNVVDCEDCNRLDMDCVSKGLGDTIASITHALGIPKCESCGQRQNKLNEMFPYRNK